MRKNTLTSQLIFFDASGTLFDVRETVGAVYGRFARRYGVEVEPETLQQDFLRAFRSQPPMAFPAGLPAAELKPLEYRWWARLAREAFGKVEFPRFDDFFAETFDFYGTTEAWAVFDDVAPALEALKARGLRLAVISNFDSRLEDLIRGFGLDRYFDAVHYSTRMGAAKPDPAIFRAALAEHKVQAEQAVHIGDSLGADVEGATAAGLRAVLLDRTGTVISSDGVRRITGLGELL
jgi:putative hydrolase of the HAD superfamily